LLKLLVLNPVSVDLWNTLVYNYVKSVLEPSTEVVVKSIKEAPQAIECDYDKALAEHLVVREVVEAEKEGFSAVVINCFDDPGLRAAREVVDIPVFGIGETSLYYALVLGDNIAIVSTGRNSVVVYRRKARELGIDSRVVYVSGIEVPVLELRSSEKLVKSMLVNEISRAVSEYGAQVAVLGCGGFIGLAEELSKECGIPVVDPTLVTVKIAEMSAKLGYKHSKKYLFNRLKIPYLRQVTSTSSGTP
jgi:allantoin racemase